MGALILVAGANGSGKSLFAEELVGKTWGDRYYIATMAPQTEENFQRIEKHRRQREHLEFTTLELPYSVGEAPITAASVVLLEDVSNLLANNIFEKGVSMDMVYEDICKLLNRCELLIAVTISGLNHRDYEGETAAYIASLETLNQNLSLLACAVVEMKEGCAHWEKGKPNIITAYGSTG